MRNVARGLLATAALLIGACNNSTPDAPNNATANTDQPSAAKLTLTRLDCGSPTIKDFDAFFSDQPGLYEKGPRDITDSCYLIKHGDQLLLWDTGLTADAKGKTQDMGPIVMKLDRTIAEQLERLGVKPEDVDVVGISHMHADHTGQVGGFPQARLLIGKADFEQTAGKDDPFGPWRGQGKPVTLVTSDTDVFGDGSVVALHLPGHTPDHLALLVNLEGGAVLLSGDLYHSRDAREKRGVPPFNTSREQTLKSMDAFEKLASDRDARVIIQHEPRDIELLPQFPQAAQ